MAGRALQAVSRADPRSSVCWDHLILTHKTAFFHPILFHHGNIKTVLSYDTEGQELYILAASVHRALGKRRKRVLLQQATQLPRQDGRKSSWELLGPLVVLLKLLTELMGRSQSCGGPLGKLSLDMSTNALPAMNCHLYPVHVLLVGLLNG